MLKPVDENFKKYCVTKDGSYLKKIRSIGGGSAALTAAGFLIAGICALLIAATKDVVTAEGLTLFAAVAAGSALLAIIGIFMRRRRIRTYLEYFSKKSGYTPDQLKEFEREVLEPDSCYDTVSRKLAKNSAAFSWVLTEHWFKQMDHIPIRIEDMAAAFYMNGITYKKIQYGKSIFFVLKDGTIHDVYNWQYDKEGTARIVEELRKRNPLLIPAKSVRAGEEVYNCLEQPERVAELYRSARERRS